MIVAFRYGIKLLLLFSVFTILFSCLGILFHFLFFPFSFIFLLGLLFVIWFFRNPSRHADDSSGILSPADGIILSFRGDNVVRVFMSLFDVHVNRAPIDGKIIYQHHKHGTYVIASSKEADTNESITWKFETNIGVIKLVQIAGFFARRIVPFKKINDVVKRGEPIGMIKLGSRVDISIPDTYEIVVDENEKVYAGKTIIAHKKSS